MDSKDFTIGILSTTAVMLFVGLVIINTSQPTAWAGATTTGNGDYVLTVGTLTIHDEELVYVIDAPAEKLIAYRFNPSKRSIEVAHGLDLADMRRAANNQQPTGRRKSGRRP